MTKMFLKKRLNEIKMQKLLEEQVDMVSPKFPVSI